MDTGNADESLFSRDLNGLQNPESLAAFLETTFDAVVVFDPQERITYWNPAAAQMYGWTAREAMGKTPAELFWPMNTPQEKKSHRERQLSLQQGAMLWGEHNPCRKDGSSLWVQYAIRAVFDASGKLTSYLALYRDISIQARLREKDEQLKRSNQKLNEILASIQDDFYVINHDWFFVYANQQFASKLGKEPKDFVGNNVWKMFPKHVGLALEENFRAAMEKREMRRFEIPGQYTNAWYSITVFPSSEGITVLGTDVTESKRSEQLLKESEERFRNIFNQSPIGIGVYNADGTLVDLNRAALEMFGFPSRESILGLKLFSSPTVLAEAIMKLRNQEEIREEVVYNFEEIRRLGFYETKKSGVSYLDRIITPLRSTSTDKPFGYLSQVLDITERKRTEEALRESEERLRRTIETSLVAIVFGDSTGKILSANKAFYRLTGYSREEMQASQLGRDQLTPPEYAELDRQVIATLDATGSAGPYEKEYIRKDGSRVPLLVTVSKLPGHDEHIAFIMDITERKRTEQALAQALQELHAHLDNSPLGIVVFDPEFHITEWSAGAESMFGWRAEEVLGKTIAELRWVHEEDAQRVARLSANMLAGRRLSNMHANRNYRKDGSVIECEWYNSALLDASGKLISVRSQILNVTKRKRAEDALLESQKQLQLLNETLEQKVQEKTTQVRRLASDLIKATQRERQRISHILHDDLQQRIYAIRMQLSFLRDALPKENETTRQEASDVERQLDEMRKIVRNLSIDLSPPILPEEGLSHAVNWLAAQMQQQYGLPIELRADGPFTIPNEELHVLLFNCIRELLFNVVKHAQASRAVVTLEWSDTNLRIEVRDDGQGFSIGMLEQQMSEEDSLPSSYGLPTIRHQLNLFDGRMEIKSEPGAGTRVTLTLPIAKTG